MLVKTRRSIALLLAFLMIVTSMQFMGMSRVYAEGATIESVRTAIQALNADPSTFKATDKEAVEKIWADFQSLSSDDQATLDAETSHKDSGQPLGRVLESALWAVWSYGEVDNGTTLPDGTYDATTTPALSSTSNKGKSTSSRTRTWSVKSVTVKDGKVTGTIGVAESKSYSGIWIGGTTYPKTADVGKGCEFANVPIDLNSTFYIGAVSTSMPAPTMFEVQTTISEPAPAIEDGTYKLPDLKAGPSAMFNHFVSDSKMLIVNGDKATVRFITDGSTASIQKYTKIAIGKSSELLEKSYQPTVPDGTPVYEGTLQPYDEGTGKEKYLFEIPLSKADAEALLSNESEDDIYITIWNKVGSTEEKVPGWYKPEKDIYLSLGALGEATTAPAAAEPFRFTLQVGQYTEGADFHTASFEGVEYALKDAAGNLYEPSNATTGMVTFSNLSPANTFTFTATKEGWTVVKQGEWDVEAHAYEYIPMGTDEIKVTITKADADKNITDGTNPGMVFRKKDERERNVVDDALDAVPEGLKYGTFTAESAKALKDAINNADPEVEDEEKLNAMAKAIMDALEGLVPKDGEYEVTFTKYNGTPYYLYEGLADNDKVKGKGILVVEDGKMTVNLVVKNKSYGQVCSGTKDEVIEEATQLGKVPERTIDLTLHDEKITVNEKEYEYSTVSIPVPALQKDLAFAYHSSNTTRYTYNTGWYDHKVMFQADSLKNLNGNVDLDITNNTTMFKAVTASLVKEEDKTYLVMALSGSGYHELYKGTFAQAVKNGDGSTDKGNDTWIHGYLNDDNKWEFKIPVDDSEAFMPIVAVSQSYYEKYLKGENQLKRAFYPRQAVIDRDKATLVTGDYEETAEIAVTNNVKMFSPAETAEAHIVGGPNSNNYSVSLTLPMTTDSMDKVRAKKYKVDAGELVEDGEVEIPFVDGQFADIPVKDQELVVLEFHSVKKDEWYKRDFTLDFDSRTAVFDPHQATVDEIEDMGMDEAVEYVKANANVTLLNALIEAIQVQYRDENTDKYCACAKACWDALNADDKEEDDGYFSEDTGDASKDDPLNTKPDKEKELLVVSFGTSYNGSRVATIGAVEKALAEAFPDYAVRRAFTAQIIINHVASRDGEQIDNVAQAMDKAVAAGVKEMIVQPTHLMSGAEYDELKKEIDTYADKIDIKYAKPLLDSDADKELVAKEVVAAAAKDAGYANTEAAIADKDTAFVFMGHGTAHEAKATYTYMQQTMGKLGFTNCFVGTVEGEPEETEVHEILKKVQNGGFKKVVLRPLMVVAGDHANNDMAGDEDDSWKSIFAAALGKENVTCQIKGLGEIEAIQDLYVGHTSAVVAESEAEEVQAVINALPDLEKITRNDKQAVIDARAKYNELSAEAKALVNESKLIISELKIDIFNLEDDLTDAKADLTKVKADLEKAKADLADANTRATNAEASVKELEADLEAAKAKATAAENDLANHENALKVLRAKPALTKVKAKKGRKAVVTFKGLKNLKATSYQITYKTGKKTVKQTVKKATTTNKTLTVTSKKLKANNRYTVRVRAVYKFKYNGKTYTVYSKWSKAKKAKIK